VPSGCESPYGEVPSPTRLDNGWDHNVAFARQARRSPLDMEEVGVTSVMTVTVNKCATAPVPVTESPDDYGAVTARALVDSGAIRDARGRVDFGSRIRSIAHRGVMPLSWQRR
jgi:hypothetical protein